MVVSAGPVAQPGRVPACMGHEVNVQDSSYGGNSATVVVGALVDQGKSSLR